MPEESKNTPTPLKKGDATASLSTSALDETCKALKAVSFYPDNHPLREKILQGAFQAISNLAQEEPVSLVVQRSGLFFANQETTIGNTPMTKALALELFAREIQRLTFLPGLSLDDFAAFLSLLAMEPQKIAAAGGLGAMLTERAVQAVVVNRIDISAVFTKKKVGENVENDADSGHDVEQNAEQCAVQFEGGHFEDPNTLTVEELIALMSAETDDGRYPQLARLLLTKGQQVKSEGDFDRLFAILSGLATQHGEEARSAVQRQYSLTVLQQLASGEMTDHLLDHLEEENFGKTETVYLILSRLGTDPVEAVVGRLVAAESKIATEALTGALLHIGAPAVPALTGLMQDGRWQVVQTAVAILGKIGSRDAVSDLMVTAFHTDNRVRMETIRSLAKIGGVQATALLVDLMRDPNPAIAIHAITWLGHTRNHRSLPQLLQLIMKLDLPGKIQPLKKEAVKAVGRIGDRRALDQLFTLVNGRHWILAARWDELKMVAIDAIGSLGGESAREFLKMTSEGGGRMGRAALAALEKVDQKKTNLHD